MNWDGQRTGSSLFEFSLFTALTGKNHKEEFSWLNHSDCTEGVLWCQHFYAIYLIHSDITLNKELYLESNILVYADNELAS